MQKKLLTFALLAAVAQLSFAHGIWVAERTGTPTIIYGHGSGDDPYKAEKITYHQAFDNKGKPIDVSLNAREKNVSLQSDKNYSSIALVLDNGYWTEQENGKWVNQPKNEVSNAKSAGRYLKTALSIVGHGQLPKLDSLKALDFIILPNDDVVHSHIGDEIEVTVYFKGKPLADVALIGDYVNDDETIVATTDAKGKASVAVRNKGLNVIAADYRVDAPEAEQAKADKVGYNATLSFNNDHHKH